MNHEAERLTAWTQDEGAGRPVEEIIRVRDARTREVLESSVGRTLRERAVTHLPADAVLTSRDGSEHDVTDSSAPILDVHDQARGAVLAFRDVTQARRNRNWLEFMHQSDVLLARTLDYETTLRRAARLAVGSLADVCVVDIVQPDGSIRRLAGAHTDPAKQPLVDELVRVSRLAPDALEGTPRAIRTRQPIVYEYPNGEPRAHPGAAPLASSDTREYLQALRALELGSVLIVPLLAGGRPLGALGLGCRGRHRFEGSDVQRAHQLAHCFALAIESATLHREVRDALAVREEFLSLASHELKTPLTSLQLDLAALQKEHRGDGATATRLARAVQQCNRLAKLSENLIDVSCLSAGSIVLRLREADLRAIVVHAMERCREDAERARCPLELGAYSPVLGRCDEARVEQAVCNLIANAIKYGKGRPIELALDAIDDATARITVTDHGIGIAVEDTARIFDLFERAVPSRHYGGLGLGLYVAREIVRAHGGSIFVASKPEAGSTFTILLPTRRDARTCNAS